MSTPEGYNAQTGHMDFSLALRQMRKGLKVRRAGWATAIELSGHEFEWADGGKPYISDADILATDWEEVL